MLISRPIIFIHIATTSLSVNTARIVQLATIKINMDGQKEEKIIPINPKTPINAQAKKTHGIGDEDISSSPQFKEYAKSLLKYFDGCDIASFDANFFTLPILMKEFHLCGIEFPKWEMNVVDVLKYEKILNPNRLADVYSRRTGKKLESKHPNSLTLASATVEILFNQLGNNNEITPAEIDKICQGDRTKFDLCGKTYINSKGEVFWAMGSHENELVTKDLKYLNWVLNSDFPEETKAKLRTLIKT